MQHDYWSCTLLLQIHIRAECPEPWGLKNKPCKRNNRQNSDNTKNAAKQGNAEERPDADCGIKR